MSDTSAFGFGPFVPGFDFLQNLTKTAAQAQPAGAGAMPGMASWVAPTLSIEEIDKRIQELKSVLFWLEQNTTGLKATIQAMEVQKMTLSTLQGMNVNMADLAKAFTAKPPVTEPAASPSATDSVAACDSAPPKASMFTPKPATVAEPQPVSQPEPEAPSHAESAKTEPAKPAVDPMQWWGALTQQFQGIAAAALKDVAAEAMKTGMVAKNAKAGSTKAKASKAAAAKSAAEPSRTAARQPATKKAAPSAAKAATRSSSQARSSTARKSAPR